MTRAALILIRAYQLLLSPVLPPACRFYPTCSEYTREALEKWGLLRGLFLSVKRLARCHPFGGHGFDPVPEGSRQVSGAACQTGIRAGSILES